ncbi:SGNH/GDSL hydrolase family protein [Falsiroseomonas oryziterrae]|uniref:SGNH/GDSL hydrolase family protein n=1 Tax=Falsiroseomonas oryziterrae TaxID=2911368 RepID=UPI001F21FCED|nr:GDSL-type esterase/lipase family protein [Roseomonas sp. NPKOSM-4]
MVGKMMLTRHGRIPLAALGLLTALAAPAGASPCPAGPAGAVVEARLNAGRPLTIVALGSSSTEGAGASGPHATYPARLEALLRGALPGRTVRVINAGRSGQTSDEMLARIENQVLVRRPSLVIWQAGGNEALKGRSPEEFERVMREGLRRLAMAGIPVVLLDNQRSPRMVAAGGERFDAVMAALAEARGVGLFRRGAWQASAPDPQALVAGDGLHMNDAGYACLAQALAEAILPAVEPPAPAFAAARR